MGKEKRAPEEDIGPWPLCTFFWPALLLVDRIATDERTELPDLPDFVYEPLPTSFHLVRRQGCYIHGSG